MTDLIEDLLEALARGLAVATFFGANILQTKKPYI